MANEIRLVDNDTERAVLDAYRSGQPLLAIERAHGLPRTTVHWVLKRHGLMPTTAKERTRFKLAPDDEAHLFRLIESQEASLRDWEYRAGLVLETVAQSAPDALAAVRTILDPDGSSIR